MKKVTLRATIPIYVLMKRDYVFGAYAQYAEALAVAKKLAGGRWRRKAHQPENAPMLLSGETLTFDGPKASITVSHVHLI